MKFLVIVQDLRISGTSAGIGRRSLLVKIRKAYPFSQIDVHYLIHRNTDDRLDLLPVNSIKKHIVNVKTPTYITFLNRFYWRLFHVSLKERYIYKQYANYIAEINYSNYDHVLVTSSGINHETILALHGLPILSRANIVFHDPYPLAWYVGTKQSLSNLDLFRLKRTIEVVAEAKTCSSTALNMSHDLQHLYAAKKKFYTLPHQFDASVFDLSDKSQVLKKSKKVAISYHGALMFGRNIENLLVAYEELLKENPKYIEQTEIILRVKGEGVSKLKSRFATVSNIQILDTINFSNSSNEQIHESDIVVILENGPLYCNILVGKAPFLAAYHKPVLCISPEKSELRKIITDERCIANMNDVSEIKQKLQVLIEDRLVSQEPFYPFGDYFSEDNFKLKLDVILQDTTYVRKN
ncbi:hypothetical protein FLJC2902T_29730 [Flavobacterium limnosediminis JC2902]|uniref:Glycosyl transferase family 1 domain-containing protein n=1 Tax=Flavobacterium limnosediminis JC2902 TaxID=1341181 RepID=V6SI65_9FLAO|nr:hypothetical protein [Flavobacterium limnosediminis]ESU25962.1 hypothetical protein FLJC2902T_29730 [Flavobacterium limnosediminis JC2902]